MPRSDAMGSSLGNWEFDSQTNHNADCVPEENIFKFVDDLTCLEIVNLINNGIFSFNTNQQVPNDLPLHSQFVDNKQLISQQYLDTINNWTEKQEMVLSEKKLR